MFSQLTFHQKHVCIVFLFQLFFYLKSSLPQVQDACLLLLKLCAKSSENVRMLLDFNILEFLLNCLQSSDSTLLIRPALLLLEVVCNFVVLIIFHFLWDHWAHCCIFENGVLLMYMLEGIDSVANLITEGQPIYSTTNFAG